MTPVSGPEQGRPPHRPDSAAGYARRAGQALAATLRLQMVVAVTVSMVLLAVGPVVSYSSLCGSLAVYVPAWLFSLLVGRRFGGDSSVFLRTAALAEFGKLALTGVLCAVAFVWVRPLAFGAFFAGMIAVLVAGWIGLGRAFR